MLSPTAQQRFGAHVRQHRVQEGLSLAELADLLDLPPALDLGGIEAGDGIGALDLGIAIDLADFCGLTVTQMLGEGPGTGAA